LGLRIARFFFGLRITRSRPNGVVSVPPVLRVSV
jgi:hypothetical protein